MSGAQPTGIEAIGISLPPLSMELDELARLRGVDPDKYRLGLGCREMALCPPEFGVVELAARAAERALERWGGDRERVGLLAVGTETAVDMSRPLSAWVAERLGLAGSIRSYEVKHACYGGTLALRQAAEWRMSGAARDRVALVVAADVALYEPGDPGEPTQGAGGVAMVVGEPEVATIEAETATWSEPAFDFWRPVAEAFPRVDGPLSLDCYKRAAERCFSTLVGGRDPQQVFDDLAAICFHVPFPKMVRKALAQVGEAFGLETTAVATLFDGKVAPTMGWNERIGNAYTASLWIAVAHALRGLVEGQRLAAFSYGSGFGAELLVLHAGPAAATGAWATDVECDLRNRRRVTAAEYVRMRSGV